MAGPFRSPTAGVRVCPARWRSSRTLDASLRIVTAATNSSELREQRPGYQATAERLIVACDFGGERVRRLVVVAPGARTDAVRQRRSPMMKRRMDNPSPRNFGRELVMCSTRLALEPVQRYER